jgi:hypothetical protein
MSKELRKIGSTPAMLKTSCLGRNFFMTIFVFRRFRHAALTRRHLLHPTLLLDLDVNQVSFGQKNDTNIPIHCSLQLKFTVKVYSKSLQ